MSDDDNEETIALTEDGAPWEPEEIEEFMEDYDPEQFSVGRDSNEQPEVNGGAVMVGLVLTFLIAFALFSNMWIYVMYCSALLVVLSLGSKALN